MKQSTELLDVAHRFFEAISGRAFSLLDASISNHEDALFIGSDPGDWYVGKDAFMKQLKAEFNEGGHVKFEISDAKTYLEGVSGSFGGKVDMVHANGSRIPFRCTLAFHQKDNHWEITQMHFSIAVPNDFIGQVIGSYRDEQ